MSTPSSSSLRQSVLSIYRSLYRTRLIVFANDPPVIKASLDELRRNFRSRKDLTDENEILEMLKNASEAQDFLMKNVIQIRSKKYNKNQFQGVLERRHLEKDQQTNNK